MANFTGSIIYLTSSLKGNYGTFLSKMIIPNYSILTADLNGFKSCKIYSKFVNIKTYYAFRGKNQKGITKTWTNNSGNPTDGAPKNATNIEFIKKWSWKDG